MSINLTRDASNGRILSNGAPIILRGGHYWISKQGDNPGRCLVKPGETLPFKAQYNAVPPCQTASFPVEELLWQSEPWDMLFSHLKTMNCNFLRIWLTGGTVVSGSGVEPKPLDATPFVLVKRGTKWKWQVQQAVVNNQWNNEYFRKLNAFATAAENAGVVIQISLFNYLDLVRRFDGGNFRAWCRSPYNPVMSDNPASDPTWSQRFLVDVGESFSCSDAPNNVYENQRQAFFLAPDNQLRVVQRALVNKTVQTLAARTNIIYEIMNEPRGTHDQAAKFSSAVTGWILAAAGATRRPLISVNASNLAGGAFDTDYWRNTPSIPNYDKLDAISYHGLTGFTSAAQTVCGKTTSVPAVDPGAIQSRFNKHRATHITKSLIYCTDAARAGLHTYPGTNGDEYELQVRDGQIWTNYPHVNSDTAQQQRIKSDLQNWAYWCFTNAVPNAGMAHFQNHSMNQMAFRRIGAALNEAIAMPMTLTAIEPAAETARLEESAEV